VGFVAALVGRDDRRETDQGVVDTWVWDKVGLELVEIDVERTIETQAGCDRADNLSDETVQVLEIWARDIEILAADVVHSFVVNEERAV
jgi:hypothetical protein